jgi:hypothetical protein
MVRPHTAARSSMHLLLLLGGALGQGPFDGMSKTTLAAATDPLGAMAFMQRHFGATPDHDSCDANVCLCDAGDSNSSSAWSAVLGRCDLERVGHPAGRCILHTASGGTARAASETVTVTPSMQPGVDCKYQPGTRVSPGDADKGYTVHAHDADTCCKSCVALSQCVSATYVPASNSSARRRLGPPTYEGFGLHLPAVTAHVTTGGLSVTEIESIYSSKLECAHSRDSQSTCALPAWNFTISCPHAAMATFDAWLDYSVGLFTTRMDDYLRKLSSSRVPIFAARWPAQSGASVPVMFYSAFVHVPNSQARGPTVLAA